MSSDVSTRTLRVVLLAEPAEQERLRAALSPDADVRISADAEAALKSLAECPADCLLASHPQLLRLAERVAQDEARTALDIINHGVCTFDRGGAVVWANRVFSSFTAAARTAILKAADDLLIESMSAVTEQSQTPTTRRLIDFNGEFYFEVSVSPLAGSDARGVAIVADVSATHRLQEKLDAIDRAGQELVRIDTELLAEMDVDERLAVLEERIIRSSRELLHFQHFEVRILDKQNKKLRLLLAEGMTEEAKRRDLAALNDGNGITGYVAATGRSYICPDSHRDSRVLPGIEHLRSSLTVPLRLNDEVIGTLNVESEHVAAFNEDDRQFAEIFGHYIALALNTLRLLACERHAMSDQFVADLSSSLAAPLDDIVTRASNLIEEHIGHDDLRKALYAIIEDVDVAKKRVQQIRGAAHFTGLPVEADFDPVLADRKILVADDEEVIRETVIDVLSKAGASVVSASDGHDAVSILRAQKFDLVISDIKMPRCSGYEVFSAAKEFHADTRVIFITGFGYDPGHSIVRASKEGLAGVLFKPFKVERLLEEARQALRTP